MHPLNQQNALKGVLEEVGWVQEVIINQRTGHLVDGHLRCQLAAREGAKTIPVKYVDLSEDEEALVLSTLDPIAAMAVTDKQKLDDLFASIETENADVLKMLDDIAEKERLEYAKKRPYVELARDVRDLQKFGDERDLEAAEETLARICATAKDFPAARIRSKIRTAKQASDMAVLAAKQAALINGREGQEKVAEQLALAAKIWPLNPGIKNFMTEMTGRVDLVSQRMPEFDKLHDAGKFRELFDRKEEFALALIQDKPRMDKLNEVLGRIGRIEALVEQAESLAAQGNRYHAWDFVLEAGRVDPNDAKVAALRSRLAPQVADYAKLLADAARAEAESRPGSALTAYLAAQDLNRGSKYCQDAVGRVSRAMLDAAPGAVTASPAEPAK